MKGKNKVLWNSGELTSSLEGIKYVGKVHEGG